MGDVPSDFMEYPPFSASNNFTKILYSANPLKSKIFKKCQIILALNT